MCHFHISLIKAFDVSYISNFALLVFFKIIYCKTAILHTLTYHDLHPLWISLVTTLLLPVMTENPINLFEDEGEDDCEVPGELVRLLLQEERGLPPPNHQF